MAPTALLLLCDGRFPAGGHAHSGGLEAAVGGGRVHDLASLREYLVGRLETAGLVTAAFAAAACAGTGPSTLDDELDARTPSPALRLASRRQGRALSRAGRLTWPSVRYAGLCAQPHHPVALGVVAAAAGLSPAQAALAGAYTALTGPAGAAVRLLALDPFAVQAVLAELTSTVDELAGRAAGYAGAPVEELPAAGAPLTDIAAEIHASWEVRLFAS
jgi:urease accessory protein